MTAMHFPIDCGGLLKGVLRGVLRKNGRRKQVRFICTKIVNCERLDKNGNQLHFEQSLSGAVYNLHETWIHDIRSKLICKPSIKTQEGLRI